VICTREVIGSNFECHINYHDSQFPWFQSVYPGKSWGVPHIRPRPLPSKSFPIHYWLTILSFNLKFSELMTLFKQEILGKTNRLLSLIRHGPHWKRHVQQLFYCCVCIRYRGNVSTEPLPRNDWGIFTEPSRCLTTTRGFLPSRCLATIGGYTDSHTQTARWSHKPTLFFKIRKVG
jgi:hypothetical protein